MKSYSQTRIVLSMTLDEARLGVNNPTDVQLAIRNALYQVDGVPVAQLIEQNHKQLPAPNGKRKPARPTKTPTHVCPGCGQAFAKPGNLSKHIARAHPDIQPVEA